MNRCSVVSIAALVLFLIPLLAFAAPSGPARITLTKGEVLLFDDEINEWVPAAVNTPIVEGDRLWCADGARAEIELMNGSNIRMSGKTALDAVRLDTDEQQFYLGTGRLYIRTTDQGDDIQIDTEDAVVNAGKKSRIYIDLVGGEEVDTEVSVVKGNAYVESISGKTRVRSGESLLFSENGAELAPLNEPGEWEAWNEKRDRKLSKLAEQSRLPQELVQYEQELSSNGNWITIEEYGYAWRPTVSVGIDWAPYRNGRWVWRRGNYVWIDREPWGWAPFHYGRWHHHPSHNWVWIPPRAGDVYWSPGYVAWVDSPSDLAWIPLAPGEIYYGRGNFGSLSINITNIDQRTIVKPITVYRNAVIRNAVSRINKEQFASGRGKPVKSQPPPRGAAHVVAAPPTIRPTAREARMPRIKKVSFESRPPSSLQLHQPQQMKERFPRLDRERLRKSSDRPAEMRRDRQPSDTVKQQPAPTVSKPLPVRPPAMTTEKELPRKGERSRDQATPPSVPTRQQSDDKPNRQHIRPHEPVQRSSVQTVTTERKQQVETKPSAQPQAGDRRAHPKKVWQVAPREERKEKPTPQTHMKERGKEQKEPQGSKKKEN